MLLLTFLISLYLCLCVCVCVFSFAYLILWAFWLLLWFWFSFSERAVSKTNLYGAPLLYVLVLLAFKGLLLVPFDFLFLFFNLLFIITVWWSLKTTLSNEFSLCFSKFLGLIFLLYMNLIWLLMRKFYLNARDRSFCIEKKFSWLTKAKGKDQSSNYHCGFLFLSFAIFVLGFITCQFGCFLSFSLSFSHRFCKIHCASSSVVF